MGSNDTAATQAAPPGAPKKGMRGLWIFLAVAAAVWLASPFALRWLIPTLDSRGVFGDSFGALNALFSGLAFAGVVYAILQQNESRDQQAEGLRLQLEALRIQQQDLRLQLDEMKATREEMQRQTEASTRQAAALEKQRRAQLIGAAITAQTAFLHDVFERAKVNNWGFTGTNQAPTEHARASSSLSHLVEMVLADLGLDHDGRPLGGAALPGRFDPL